MQNRTLPPKELGQAIGVSESSLKRWADGGRLRVARTAGGHRRIDLSEAIRFIRASGLPIVRPGVLGLNDVPGLTDRRHAREDAAGHFHTALAAGHNELARTIVVSLYLDGVALSAIIDDVIAPAVRRIGDLWRHDDAGIYVEHRAVDCCVQALNRVRDLAEPEPRAPIAVGGAPEHDPYWLPSLLAASVLTADGWSAINLGAFTPARVLARAAVDSGARLVWLPLSVEPGGDDIRSQVQALLEALDSVRCTAGVVVGGPAVRALAPPAVPGTCFADSMAALSAFSRGLLAHAGPSPDGGATRVPGR